jgi:hypothetical protein
MRGLPPCSWILASKLKVRLLKNSTQNAGSKEEAKELLSWFFGAFRLEGWVPFSGR